MFFFVLLTPNLHSGFLTPVDVVEAQPIYTCIFKISICEPNKVQGVPFFGLGASGKSSRERTVDS